MIKMFNLQRVLSILCCIALISTVITGVFLIPVNVSAATLSLSSYYNKDMFSYDTNRSNGSYTSLYSADLANSSITIFGASYNLGSFTDGSNNIVECSGQTITLTQAMYSAIGFLGSATDCDSTGMATGKFRINYTDGTYSESRITFADWTTSDNNVLSSQYIAQTMGCN